jgi:hypothetical protein
MLIDFFHNLYNATFKLGLPWLNRIRLPAVLRLLILLTANIIIPLVFKVQHSNSQYRLANSDSSETKTGFTVSLTSFPQRIDKVYLVIESILRQAEIPSRLVLWLSKEQFNSIESLPKNLLKLRSRGLEIILTPGDLRSFKKYYFLLKEQPGANFIIIDDDIFYPSSVLQNLIETHKQYPTAVCANRCYQIEKDKSYSDWKLLRGEGSQPRSDLLPTGCGGVLYPGNSLPADAINKNLFTELCKDADDIWLNCTAYSKGAKFVYTGKNEYFLSVRSNNNVYLHTQNVGNSFNDLRIKMVRDYYLKERKIDIMER